MALVTGINESDECLWKCQNLNKFPDVSGLSPSSMECSLWVAPRFQVLNLNLKVAFCTRARTSNEVKISIEAARLACPESKDETHFLPLPLLVPIAEFDPPNQCVSCGMPVRTEMLCDGETRRILVNASEMFTKTFPQSAPSLADVNGVSQRKRPSFGLCLESLLGQVLNCETVKVTQPNNILRCHF